MKALEVRCLTHDKLIPLIRSYSVQSKLSTSLSNARALHALLRASSVSLNSSSTRADRALTQHVPYTSTALRHAGSALSHLAEELPDVRDQTAQVARCYVSGKEKARELISELEFMNLPFFTRTLSVIFGPSPVSARRALVLRITFGVLVLVFSWVVWVTFNDIVRTQELGDMMRGWGA
jgi:hypothetical protein